MYTTAHTPLSKEWLNAIKINLKVCYLWFYEMSLLLKCIQSCFIFYLLGRLNFYLYAYLLGRLKHEGIFTIMSWNRNTSSFQEFQNKNLFKSYMSCYQEFIHFKNPRCCYWSNFLKCRNHSRCATEILTQIDSILHSLPKASTLEYIKQELPPTKGLP